MRENFLNPARAHVPVDLFFQAQYTISQLGTWLCSIPFFKA
jgi:hypothetical protein